MRIKGRNYCEVFNHYTNEKLHTIRYDMYNFDICNKHYKKYRRATRLKKLRRKLL